MKYCETLHSFLRGKNLNSHRSSSDSSQVLLVGWIQFLQKCRCELQKNRVSMQKVWCLVLEMSSGSQALTLPGFPAPPGSVCRDNARVWYNCAFLWGYLFIWWGIGIFWLNPPVSANAAWGRSKEKALRIFNIPEISGASWIKIL